MQETQPLNVLVTTGATKEFIDDVRYLANSSSGKFGYEIAKAFAVRGHCVTVLCPPDAPLEKVYPIQHLHFTNAADLEALIQKQENIDIVIHAAAVSDFRPIKRTDGKMVSKYMEMLAVNFERVPKILAGMRQHFGTKTFIAGFKTLSSASRLELVDASMYQNTRYRLNMTIAHDIKELHLDAHPVTLITPEGGALRFNGIRASIAHEITNFILKRFAVRWFKTELIEMRPTIPDTQSAEFGRLLAFAQNTNLLYDTSGNVSVCKEGAIAITPRQVNKKQVQPGCVCFASVDADRQSIHCLGKRKPSIDTGVTGMIYKKFPDITHMLHFHDHWGYFSKLTQFPYPCGVMEEGEEILRVLGEKPCNEFAIELLHHGALIGLTAEKLCRMEEEWAEVMYEYAKHLVKIQRGLDFAADTLKPIFADTRIVGVLRKFSGNTSVAVFLAPDARGYGLGQAIIRQLIQRQTPVRTIDSCEVRRFYKKHGFTELYDAHEDVYTLIPPHITKLNPLFYPL